jgi:hypothetical protein
MRVALPHNLERAEVRIRLKSRSHEIAGHIPGGMAQVATEWPSEDRMTMTILAMGQQMGGAIEIEDRQVVLDFDMPPALGFLEPIIEGAVRKQGQNLLAPPSD